MIIINRPPRRPDPPELRLGTEANILLDGGLNLKYDPTQIKINQSPYMLNMTADDRGTLSKRGGQAHLYSSSLGAGGVNGAYERLYNGFRVFAWGTQLYKQSGTAAPTSIIGGLANAKGTFFAFNGKLYYLNGTNYVVIDSALSAANVVGFIPTLYISMNPAGKGDAFQQGNLISSGFKISYSGDGTSTLYQLPLTNLDATTVTITIDTVAKTEGTHFTVNRTTGTINFAAGTSPHGAPANGTNNVIVTAYKTISGNANRILNCKYAIDYGGDNDTRVFFWGNSNFKNRVFRSGLLDPTYWPENEYSDVGSSSEAVMACAKHYDKLVYLKERSIAFTTYTNPVTQGFWGASQIGASFPLYWINGAVGCDMPGSVQVIDNNVVFGNSELGLFIIVNVSVRDERNVRPISGNINGAPGRPGLLDLATSDLQNASSVDFDGKYWLCVGNQAYVWDYRLSPFVNTGDVATDEERLAWFPQSNINAACWMQDDRQLYYGDRSTGQWVQFVSNYNDFGAAINAVWTSKRYNFDLPDWLKTVTRMWFTAKAGGFSTVTIKYISENGETLDTEEVNSGSFRWDQATWANWTWRVNEYPPPAQLKPKLKKIVYFQVEFSNNVANQNLSLMSLIIQYMAVKKVK